MPLQLLSRSATDTIRSRSPSPLATPATKPQIPTIRLTTATPCNADATTDANLVAPWTLHEPSPVPIAPKLTTNGEPSRKRLVPKKSKLSLLGASAKREQDFSDVVRRVGGAPSEDGSNSFEIYVDPANDPDIGEILMVKKKKSRLALDGLQWGTLGEVTNVPPATKPKEKGGKKDNLLKVRLDENQKWWSIGRGRKDSKEKDRGKDKERAKSPEPIEKPVDARGRYNSLGSGALLANPSIAEDPEVQVENLRIPTPPSVPSAAGLGGGTKGSVALRAMRSVRSLARIGSWAQLRNTPNPDASAAPVALAKEKESDGKKKKKKKDKEKEKDKIKETIRYSGSSFEAGALSASPTGSKHETKSLGKKKASILGLGLPSTMRLPTTRSGSLGSSILATRRSSADSATLLGGGILARERSGSTMSTASSLRPASRGSRESSGSSGTTSVKWDEVGLQTVKEIRRKDRESRRREKEALMDKETSKKKSKRSKKSKYSKDSTRESTHKSSDSRKRMPLSAIFPGTVSEREEEKDVMPILLIEAATDDERKAVHEAEGSPMETPIKRVRPRPVSDQPLGKSRPTPYYEGDDDNAVMSLLDAATNDLAQLINRLDLEATPGSVEITPGDRSPFLQEASERAPPKDILPAESPVKGLRHKDSSIASLRPYAQTCSKNCGVKLGQNIVPWSALNADISPSKPSPSTIRVKVQDNQATVRTHGRTMTPAPAKDPSPVFKALRPAATRLPISKTIVSDSGGVSSCVVNTKGRPPSTFTFGSGHSKSESEGSLVPSPVFKKAQSLIRKRSALVPQSTLNSGNLPILPEVRRSLGLAGTMGGSVGSIAEQDCDGSDPDSDIPDELQVILSNSDQEGEDTISFHHGLVHPAPASPGLPPEMPLPSPKSSLSGTPVFRASAIDKDEHHADVEETGALSEDDTKRSFDFTGELQRLNESGASDRRSFIEQLENAFRTPAKVDLRYEFADLPPIPKLPTLQDELSRAGECSFNLPINLESRELSPRGFPVDVNPEPTLLPGSDSFAMTASDDELLDIMVPTALRNGPSVASQASNGQLNRDFKFGGKHSMSKKEPSPLTLSDIIPPPEIARSLSMASFAGDESSLIKSILAHAIAIESPPERPRADSNASAKTGARESARNSYAIVGHQRQSSGLSFAGFDSFAEVRRGFEFHDGRPRFYPPPATMSGRRHRKHDSVLSIASVSSYGKVLHGGSTDPFDYGVPLPSLRERPSSDDFSFTMSTTVDDTFSFLRQQPLRRRVDSDASSFYFRTSVHPYNRNQRRESGMSIGPPVSLYNRSSIYRRRTDSNASTSSITQSSANCRRFSWTRHRPNLSVESVFSDVSGVHLGRPGLGDKMLDSALERGTPLDSISASPPASLAGSLRREPIRSEELDQHLSYDSIMDTRHETHETQKTDSLFEKTRDRNSVCSTDSTFFEEDTGDGAAKPPRYRPISSLSLQSVHSPPKEDDTMISMLGGGHVRRRSVTSMIGGSPCIQVERRKNIVTNPPETVFDRIQKTHLEGYESPEKPRIIDSKPSIASTVNSSFGDERMIRAKHGLLERQSLENTVLMGDGEDLSALSRMPVFTRPGRPNRSRSSTCTSSSGADTPPLSISDGYSSLSDGSLSSIDLSHLNSLLSNVTQPLSNVVFDRARPPHMRGLGHRRRISQARASRTSIYETIEEELSTSPSQMNSPQSAVSASASNTTKFVDVSKTIDPPQIFVVDPETSSVESFSLWDDEQGITALRRYYALRDEAEDAVTESQRTWLDTPFSLFTVQSFDPPRHPSGMKAILEHSLQNYGPLPSDLRPRRSRSRVNSRPSPYPRTVKTSFTSSPSSEHLRATVAASLVPSFDNISTAPRQPSPLSSALQQISINPNVPIIVATGAKECAVSPDKPEHVLVRQPLGLATRRTVMGLSKKSRNGVENKENKISVGAPTIANVSHGTMATPSDGLRLNRPRPKGRPTPASVRPPRGYGLSM